VLWAAGFIAINTESAMEPIANEKSNMAVTMWATLKN
jgi:hypothetical protein